MKPDRRHSDATPTPLDNIERAHLKDPRDASHVIFRYEPAPEFVGLLQRFWIPAHAQ